MKIKNLSFKRGDSSVNASYWFIGINISSGVRKLEASLVGTNGSKDGSPIVLATSVSFDLPFEITRAYEELKQTLRIESELLSARSQVSGKNSEGRGIERWQSKNYLSSKAVEDEQGTVSSSLIQFAEIRGLITALEEEAINELLREVKVQRDEIIAVIVSDPGIWIPTGLSEEHVLFLEVSDGYLLSKKTGLNVVDSLIDRDELTARQNYLTSPYWTLLSNSERGKLVVDLGETARWYYIPSRNNSSSDSWKQLIFNEVVSCGFLLDLLTKQATKGEAEIDLGGKLSVQGRCINEVLERWRNESRSLMNQGETAVKYFISPASRIFNESFYIERLVNFDLKISSVDALCTAVNWIVDRVVESIRENEAKFSDQAYDVVLTGGAKQNGLLFSKLSAGLAPRSVHLLIEYGSFLEDSFDSVAVALLGIFAILDKPILYSKGLGQEVAQTKVGRISSGTMEAARRLTNFTSSN
ncbi:MAG: anhydro-N-acetylmuramic acid kinase [Thermoguttaceae bacterium]|nr:anhydro-N-acetylmuramic acid kinase [Thermoguttaceae bacterium]